MGRKARPSGGACIFCERTRKMSREHIFARWLHKYIAISPKPSRRFSRCISGFDAAGMEQYSAFHGKLDRGGAHTRKLKIVCEECNNTWMSRIQNESKDAILKIHRGQWDSITAGDRHNLATWATMFAMVVDFIQPDIVAIPQSERTKFYKLTKPSDKGIVWIAPYSARDLAPEYDQIAIGVLDRSQRPPVLSEPIAQIVTVVMGGIIIHVCHTTAFPLWVRLNRDYSPHLNMLQIWPNFEGPSFRPEFTFKEGSVLELTKLTQTFVCRGQQFPF